MNSIVGLFDLVTDGIESQNFDVVGCVILMTVRRFKLLDAERLSGEFEKLFFNGALLLEFVANFVGKKNRASTERR